MPSPNLWMALGAGMRQGVRTYGDAKELQLKQQELERARADRLAERERQEKTDAIQRALLNTQLGDVGRQQARQKLQDSIALRGLEATLDDPTTIELARAASINLPTRELVKAGMSADGGSWFSQEGADRENQAIFPHSGIVKPPEIIEKETERARAIEQAKAITQMLRSMASGTSGIGGLADTPEGRMKAKLAYGINGNDLWGSVREPIAKSAERAGAEAAARLPYQMQLIDRTNTNRAGETGDPYFNSAFQIFSTLMPGADPNMIAQKAAELAGAAQSQQPRGAGSVRRPGAPPAARAGGGGNPATMDSLIADAVKNFGSIEKALAATDANVQSRLKAAGIDPGAYMRRLQAMKLQETLNKLAAGKQ